MTITTNFPEIGITVRYTNKIIKDLSGIYARLINQYKYKNHTFISASFHTINEKDQIVNEVNLYITSNLNHNLTESDVDVIDVRSQLEHQIQIQETKESDWTFDKFNSLKISF